MNERPLTVQKLSKLQCKRKTPLNASHHDTHLMTPHEQLPTTQFYILKQKRLVKFDKWKRKQHLFESK